MNDAFFKFAMATLAALTDEEIYIGLKEAGIDVTVKQYPEQSSLGEIGSTRKV